MRKILWLVPPGLVLSLGCGSGPESPPYKPLADTKLLMQAVVDPSAGVIFDAVGYIITEAGEEQIRPKNDEEWAAVRNQAITLSESGNLLMMAPRAKDADEWMRIAQAMVDAGAEAAKAAEAKDVDWLFDAGGNVYAVCNNCHSKYVDRDAIIKVNE